MPFLHSQEKIIFVIYSSYLAAADVKNVLGSVGANVSD
jgi:hypothetical protein